MRILALAIVFLSGCASAPAPDLDVADTAGERAASHALKMVGKPYRIGGSTPASGFDCSGLVAYAYREAGVAVAPNTDKQRLTSRAIETADLRAGDLIFFDQDGRKNSHVALYLGEGRFVHAPSSSKTVRTDRLSSVYWKKHLSDVRRLRGAS